MVKASARTAVRTAIVGVAEPMRVTLDVSSARGSHLTGAGWLFTPMGWGVARENAAE
jgi:hypothetical protein